MTEDRGSGFGRLAVQTSLHARNLWILIPIMISDRITINMVLDTGAPLSGISQRIYEALMAEGHLEPVASSSRFFNLANLTIGDGRIAQLRVRVSPRVTAVGADGVLGLDFLSQFTDIHYHVPSRVLTLDP